MLKKNQFVNVKWGTKNKEWFISKGYLFTRYGDEIVVKPEELMRTSRVKVVVICDICKEEEYEISYSAFNKSHTKKHICRTCNSTKNIIKVDCYSCNKTFESTNTAMNKSKSGNLFCSNKCVGAYNRELKSRQIEKSCMICSASYTVKPVHYESSVTCSIQCQHKWQSIYLVGENANNYQGGEREKNCLNCKTVYVCESPYQFKNRKFCGVECRQDYWANNTIKTNSFKERKRRGNIAYREKMSNSYIETKPERLMREYLQSLGLVKNIDFIQEKPFFGKYFADFYLPHNNLIIEVHGDYWHGNPNIYGDGKIELNDSQKDRIARDIRKKKDFQDSNFLYFEVWESDIYNNLETVMKRTCLKYIPVTTTRRTPDSHHAKGEDIV